MYIFLNTRIPRSDLMEGEWLPLDNKTRYLNIVAEKPGMMNQSMPFHNRMAFLNHLFSSERTQKEL